MAVILAAWCYKGGKQQSEKTSLFQDKKLA